METKKEIKRGGSGDQSARNSAIIQEVRENVWVYDLAHEDYKNNVKKSNVWASIAENLELSDAKEASGIWKGLRAYYMATKKKKPSGSQAEKVKKWAHADEMSFLDNFIRERPDQSSSLSTKSGTQACEIPIDDDETVQIDLSNDTPVRAKKPKISPYALKKDYLQVPSTEEEWIDIADKLFSRWDCPNTLGAIDGKHILIKRPSHSGSLYYNYKGTFSTVLLAVCDADYRCIYASYGHYGHQGDAGIFDRGDFKKAIESGD